MKKIKYILLCGLCLHISVQAQTFDFEHYLSEVAKNNAGYLAALYNVDIAVAEEQAAKVLNDPEISFTYGNNQDWNLQMGQTYEAALSYTIPLGPVRSSQMRVAAANRHMEEAVVADYWCSLKMEVANMYAATWLAKKNAELQKENYEIMQRIAHGDSLRLQIGDINPTDAMQSALEAHTQRAKWMVARTEHTNALTTLSAYIGGLPVDSIVDITPSTTFTDIERYSVSELQQLACNNRHDLKAAQWEKTVSEQNLRLVKAQRSPEITLNAGYVHSNEVRNEIAPAPKYDGFSVGVALPLKFSSANKGEKIVAENQLKQNELNLQALQQQVCAEVEQAYNSYTMAQELLAGYSTELLKQAYTIRHNRQLAYVKGNIGLLTWLEANRTYCEILSAYYEAIANAFTASAALQRSIGQ